MIEKLGPYAPLLLRLGIATVLLLFGYHKLNLETVAQGRGEIEIIFGVPLAVAAPTNYYVGLFEVMLGISLVLGWWIKRTAFLSAGLIGVIFAAIVISIGWNAQDTTLIKDIGLVGAGLALWILGAGAASIDTKKGNPIQSYIPTSYAPVVMRLTLGIVLAFLGYESWRLGHTPIAIIELVSAGGLLIGFATNYIAPIAAGVFIYIMYGLTTSFSGAENLTVINDPTRFRDMGLIASALALTLLGSGKWSADAAIKKPNPTTTPTPLTS